MRALRIGIIAVLVGAAVVVAPGTAMAAPTFKVPFPCGQTWSGQTRTNHSPANAIDFNRTDDLGDPVVASAPGTVDVVTNLGSTSYGKYVRINHGGGYTTYYAHLNGFNVSVGAVGGLRLGHRLGRAPPAARPVRTCTTSSARRHRRFRSGSTVRSRSTGARRTTPVTMPAAAVRPAR